ncbi:MAG: UDP-N-acetylmuramoyl-tripeptide--D-alanyl-D-alanine ligase [Bacteroidales bacterium]|nr:UDP-N-acetylmuramoyl-tripeptide--D-alanyl-D-alanine ligase [Bacteroidales bacterium]
MNIQELHKIFLSYPIVSTDTRKIEKNSIFFALKGANFDANKFVVEALNKGVAYAVADDEELAKLNDNRIILVKNVLQTLQALARYHRDTIDIPVLAITGTNGKTTTKELITVALSPAHNVLSTIGNLNNSIGVPLTLLRLRSEHTIAVIEMGASHPGDIKELVNVANPTYGIITNVGRAHLQGFGSYEGVISTKCELYDYINAKQGKLFVRNEDEVLMQRSEGIDRVLYGASPILNINGKIISVSPFLEAKIECAGVSYDIDTNLIGKYNIDNVVAASAIASYFGVPMQEIAKAISSYMPSNSRSQFIKGERNNIILDAYNANPSSMKVAIENFSDVKADEKMLILGDMLELGEESEREHTTIVKLLEQLNFTDVILVGKEFYGVTSQYKKFSTTAELIDCLKHSNIKTKTILIKGSRGIALEQAVEYLK